MTGSAAQWRGRLSSTVSPPGSSRFAYLVSLLPAEIVSDLGLELELRSRRIASYTPIGESGLLVERTPAAATAASFAALTGSEAEYRRWGELEAELNGFAQVVAPTLTQPLPPRV